MPTEFRGWQNLIYTVTKLGAGKPIGGSTPGRTTHLSLHQSVQTEVGAHPLSYSKSTEGRFPGYKAAGAWL